MEERDLLGLLKQKFGDSIVQRGLELVGAGVRLEKDHRMIDPGRGIFRDYGVASISRTESKVEFDLESLSPQCLSCGLARGTVCHHAIAALVVANRQGFLDDDRVRRMIGSLYGIRERGADVARRVCPNCRRPLEITSQIVCPKCGRAVCGDCYKKDHGMCSKCFEITVLGKKPKVGLGDVMRAMFHRK